MTRFFSHQPPSKLEPCSDWQLKIWISLQRISRSGNLRDRIAVSEEMEPLLLGVDVEFPGVSYLFWSIFLSILISFLFGRQVLASAFFLVLVFRYCSFSFRLSFIPWRLATTLGESQVFSTPPSSDYATSNGQSLPREIFWIIFVFYLGSFLSSLLSGSRDPGGWEGWLWWRDKSVIHFFPYFFFANGELETVNQI